jgi:aconitate hydratase A / 2-methylisocitrate dehydratase
MPAYGEAEASRVWRELDAPRTTIFPWDEKSTYIRRPPFAGVGKGSLLGTYSARPLLVLGDDITTDHISPAGAIPAASETGRYLIEMGDNPTDLNVYASRRGNWEAMVRGLFTNQTVHNMLGEEIPAGSTIHWPSQKVLPLWRAAQKYAGENQPIVIVAGERYGMGSSRDWAAKGVSLLGVRAVLAWSFERIHRSNLIGMGILPMRLPSEYGPSVLNLKSGDVLEIRADEDLIAPRCPVNVTIRRADSNETSFVATAAIETTAEVDTLKAGGLLPLILQDVVRRSAVTSGTSEDSKRLS